MLVYDGIDHGGGVQYSRYDRNRVEAVYKEALRKEKDLRDKYPTSTTFQMNMVNGNMKGDLASLKHSHNPNMIIAEKPHKRTPQERNNPPKHRDPGAAFGDNIITHMEKAPWQKVDLPQSRAQEIGWLVAASIQSQTLNAQRNHSTRANPVGHARVEAYRSSSLADLSRGQLDESGEHCRDKTLHKSRSEAELPRLVPHLPDEGMRPDAKKLNNTRFRRPKNTCDLTLYADKYYAVMRHSPFNQAAARGGKPPTESRD